MAKLEFKVAADYKEVDKLTDSVDRLENKVKGLKSSDLGLDSWIAQFDKFQRELKAKASEIEMLKARILSFDNVQDRKELDNLGRQLETAKNQYYQLAQEAADGANRFQASFNKASSALLASQKNVDSVTWKLIEQKEVVANLQSEVRRLNEAYRAAGKDEKGAISAQLTSKKQQLEDERVSLNNLRAEQERAKLAVKNLRDEVASYEKTTRSVTGVQNENEISLKKMLAAFGGAAAIKSFVSDMVRVRGEFQKTQMAFETMLGSKEKADMLMSQMIQTAAKTPFDLQGVADGAKQLLAYGTEAKDVNDTLIRLGNIASGLNIPLGEMVYLYGTTQTQGRLFTQDVRQFMGRGIPLVKEMASLLGKTEEEINKMVTAGQIGFPEVQQVIEKMTNEGGKFYNLMEKQSQTLSGQISNLGDAWDQMLNSIGEETQGVTSATISMATNVVENYEEVGKVLVALIGLYGTYKAATITYYALSKTYGMYDVATKELQFAATMKNVVATQLLTAKQAILNKTMLLNPYALFAAAVIGVVSAMVYLNKETDYAGKAQKRLDKAIKEAEKGALSEQRELAKLKGELSAATKGTDEYNKIRDKIVANYGKYDKNLKEEIDKVGLLDKTYQKLTESIQHSFDVRQYDKFRQEQEAALNDVMSDNLDNIYNKLISKHGEELGSKYYTQIKTALITGAEIPAEANKVISDTYGIWAQSLHHYVKNIREARKATEDADRRARTKFGIKDGKKTNNDEDGKSVLPSVTEEIKDATKKIATLKQELADLRSGKTTVEVGKTVQSVIEEKTKELKATENALATLTGKTTKETDKGLKAQQELSRSILDSELKLQADRIAIMQDGKDKRVLLADQEYKETIAAIGKARAEYQKKVKEAGQTEDPAVMATFDSRESAAKSKRDTDVAGINKEYFDDYAKRTKALTDVFLSEEKKRLSAVKERYEKERKWADEQLKTGGMSEEQYQTYVINIDKAEAQENYKTLLDNLNDYKQQEKNLREKWDTDINAAIETKDAYLVSKLMEGKQKALSALNSQMLQESSEWMRLFGNLDTLTVDELNKLIDSIQQQLDSGTITLNPVDAKALMDSLNQAKEKVAEKNPFQALAKSSEEMKKALANLKQAEADGLTGEQLDVYKKKVKDAAENVKKSISAIRNAYGQVSDVMKSAGDLIGMVDEGLGETVNNAIALGDAVMNVGEVVANAVIAFASGMNAMESASVILLVIKAVLMAVMAAISLFNGDKKHEKKIKNLQEKVDSLSRAYNRLGEAIEDAYSTDKADLIDKESENLRQQNELIRQQIREEEDKKKTDKDKIKDWQNAIEDNNRQIEENSKKRRVEAIMGSDIKSAIDEFAQAYADAWASGEKAAGKSADIVKSLIRTSIIEMLKKDLKPEVEAFMTFLSGVMADGIIDGAEQQQIDEWEKRLEGIADKSLAGKDKWLKGDNYEQLGITSDSLSDTILDGLQSGKSGIKDFSSSFEDMMKTAILNSLKAKYLEGPLKEFQKKFADLSESGGQLTEAEIEELRAMYADIIDGAKVQFDSLKEISGLDFLDDSDNTLKGAFAKASQESIDLLAGQTGAQRAAIEAIREMFRFIYELQKQGWQDVRIIRDLTTKVDKNTELVAENTREIRAIAQNISEHTKRTVETLEGTIDVKVKM